MLIYLSRDHMYARVRACVSELVCDLSACTHADASNEYLWLI